MFLIQSSRNDASTTDVTDWLRFLYPELVVLRRDDATVIKKVSFHISNQEERLKLKGTDDVPIDTDTLQSWWYRRGYWQFNTPPVDGSSKEYANLSIAANIYLEKELGDIEASIDQALSMFTRNINRYADNNTNKVSNLSLAAGLHLNIPETLITNDVADLEIFFRQHNRIITKAFATNFFTIDFDGDVMAGISSDTTLITEENIAQLKKNYENVLPLPACYQVYIEKQYELRIFFLNDRFYPMAIFSQANEKTRLDFRNYDEERPNRCVPYKLPRDIECKLTAFMQQLKMKSGSIDMIVTPQNNYVFLEVNPIGKYQWLRQNCNYDIDREIARFYGPNSLV